nr:ribonuclease H-like domain-containing protein [Tanacetum cinerariifolium]
MLVDLIDWVVLCSSEDLISILDLGNPLRLQKSDFNANTIISVKLTRTENYRVWAAAMKLAINTRNKTGFIDGACFKSTYANSVALSNQEDVSKHNQLIKLMKFLMGLNDVFQPIRSSLLSRETLSDVKDDFAIVSREESHRSIASCSSGSVTKSQVSGFVAKSNAWTNNGIKRYNKNPSLKSNVPRTFNVNSATSSNEKCASMSFTNEPMLKLMNLINDAPFGSAQANITVRHPNGTLAKIKYVGNLKLYENIVLFDVLVVSEEDVSKHNQLIKLMKFLMGLNDVFQPIRSSLLSRETLSDVKDDFAIVSREESHRSIASCSSGSVPKSQVSGFVAKSNAWTNNGIKRYNKNPSLKSNVPKTFNVNSATSSNEKGASMSFTNEPMLKLMNLINDAPSGSAQANITDLLVVMYCDNSSAMQIAANIVFHEKSKHFKTDVNLGREKDASGVIKTEKIHTSQQIVDILTKALDIE